MVVADDVRAQTLLADSGRRVCGPLTRNAVSLIGIRMCTNSARGAARPAVIYLRALALALLARNPIRTVRCTGTVLARCVVCARLLSGAARYARGLVLVGYLATIGACFTAFAGGAHGSGGAR